MKRMILFFCVCIALTGISAQDKPKDVKLSGVKVNARLAQVEKAMDARADKLLSADPEYMRLMGIRQGILMYQDSTMQLNDSTLTNKKGNIK